MERLKIEAISEVGKIKKLEYRNLVELKVRNLYILNFVDLGVGGVYIICKTRYLSD